MTDRDTTRPVVLAIEIGDVALAEHLRAVLGSVPGVVIAAEGVVSDVKLIRTLSGDTDAELTPREHDVLELLVDGASNKEIARRLGIAASTVKFHVRSIADKLGADGRAEAVAHALRRGIVLL